MHGQTYLDDYFSSPLDECLGGEPIDEFRGVRYKGSRIYFRTSRM